MSKEVGLRTVRGGSTLRDVGPSTVEGAISFYGPLLVGMIAQSNNGIDARMRWDKVRSRLDNLQTLIGLRSAQDVRWKLARQLELVRDRIMYLDVREQVDIILNELRTDLFANDPRAKRPLEELLD